MEWDEAQEKAALAKIEENSKNLVSPTDRGDLIDVLGFPPIRLYHDK